jgi:replicative DNA helicase
MDGAETISNALDAKVCEESFYIPANRYVWKTLLWAFRKGIPLEVSAIAAELQKLGKLEEIGGAAYLAKVSGAIPTTAGTKHAISKLQELYMLRDLIKRAEKVQEDAYGYQGDLAVFHSTMEEALRIREGLDKPKTLQEAAQDAITLVQRIQNGEATKEELGYEWPWQHANDILGTIKPGELVIIAARPSRGKSSVGRQLALRWQQQYGKTVLFSREMPVGTLPQLFAQSISGISWKQVSKGRAHAKDAMKFIDALREVQGMGNLCIQDTDRTLSQIVARVKAMKQQAPPRAIILDYIQRYDPEQQKGETRDQALGRFSMALKDMAVDLQIPVVALAQISRSVEREEREPRDSDLRESGNLEQDADRIVFCHWVQCLRGTNIAQDFNDDSVATVHTELIQTKGRGEGSGRVPLDFHRATTTFNSVQGLQ